MSAVRVFSLTAISMIAFAANSLLCRVALSTTGIDAASFTFIRLFSGAVALALLVRRGGRNRSVGGNWLSAVALFAYAAGFSFAYVLLSTATGALLLIGSVQCTMVGYGLIRGERLNGIQLCGMLVAVAGLIGLLFLGLSAPPLSGAALMLAAGLSWGIYSVRGRRSVDPKRETAGNFLRAAPLALLVSVASFRSAQFDAMGVSLAVVSGAVASGMGYVIWYSALPSLSATSAATVQLSVPALAAVGGVVFLGEPITLRLGLASLAILGGVALFLFGKNGGFRSNRAAAGDVGSSD